jgi:hypothetical protein
MQYRANFWHSQDHPALFSKGRGSQYRPAQKKGGTRIINNNNRLLYIYHDINRRLVYVDFAKNMNIILLWKNV